MSPFLKFNCPITATSPKLPRNIWVLGLAAMLTDTSSEMIHSVLPVFLVSTLGSSAITVGIIEGLAESVASVMKVFSGALSDYLHRRKAIVIAGYTISAIAKILFPLATTAWWVMLARTADRIGKGVRGAPRDALVADSVTPELRGAAFGLRQALDTTGAIAGPLLAFILITAFPGDFRLVFWCAIAPGMVAALILAFGLQEKKSETKLSKGNPLNLASLRGLGGEYWLLIAVALLFSLGNSSDAFLLLRAKQIGVPIHLIPLTMVSMNITYALSAYPLGALSDRVGRHGLFAGSLALYAAIYVLFGVADAIWQIWVLFALYGIYLGMSQGVLSALVADTVPADQRGTAFGFINLAIGITLLPASLLAGFLWENISKAAPFFAGSALAVAALFLFCLMARRKWRRLPGRT